MSRLIQVSLSRECVCVCGRFDFGIFFNVSEGFRMNWHLCTVHRHPFCATSTFCHKFNLSNSQQYCYYYCCFFIDWFPICVNALTMIIIFHDIRWYLQLQLQCASLAVSCSCSYFVYGRCDNNNNKTNRRNIGESILYNTHIIRCLCHRHSTDYCKSVRGYSVFAEGTP